MRKATILFTLIAGCGPQLNESQIQQRGCSAKVYSIRYLFERKEGSWCKDNPQILHYTCQRTMDDAKALAISALKEGKTVGYTASGSRGTHRCVVEDRMAYNVSHGAVLGGEVSAPTGQKCTFGQHKSDEIPACE